jgi:hypothetical protein
MYDEHTEHGIWKGGWKNDACRQRISLPLRFNSVKLQLGLRPGTFRRRYDFLLLVDCVLIADTLLSVRRFCDIALPLVALHLYNIWPHIDTLLRFVVAYSPGTSSTHVVGIEEINFQPLECSHQFLFVLYKLESIAPFQLVLG